MNIARVKSILQVGGSLLCVAAITFVYFRIISVNSVTVALTMLLAVLAIASSWGLVAAIVASVAGVLCFNFFFLPSMGPQRYGCGRGEASPTSSRSAFFLYSFSSTSLGRNTP